MPFGKVYLIPSPLHDDDKALQVLPSYIKEAVKDCHVFFAENERTTRRFFKKIFKEIIIDDYTWYTIHNAEDDVKTNFFREIKEGKNIGIISEAGCPGIADPGQLLIAEAHKINAKVIPLVGPSSILLALMASGMNGQCFQFNGYLPIETYERKKRIKELEAESIKKNCTQIFIETPYRNNHLVKDILVTCKPETKLCIAMNITASSESIQSKTIKEWEIKTPDVRKQPAIYLLYGSI